MSFFAIYPPSAAASSAVQTVQGEGTAGVPVGGLLTIQGDPSGTPIPISGSITATNPSVSATGSAVPASGTYVGMSVAGTLTGMTGSASGLNTVINAAIPAGTAIIGKVGIDQTTPGTTNGVQVNAALPAGTAIIGKFGIDQTTPGTTNAVALTAGTAIIGKVSIDQTTPGTTNGVQVNAAIPAGSNIIGNVRIDQTTPGTTNGVQVNAALPAGSNSIGNIGTVSTVTAVTAITNTVNVTGTGSTGTPATGIVTIQGNASGVAVPVSVSSLSPVTTSTVVWQAEGSIAFGSITNSYQTIFTPSAATKILFMRNNTNAAISVSMDSGTTLNFVLDAGDQVSVDFQANALVSTTTAIQIRYTVGAPTSGSFRVNGGH